MKHPTPEEWLAYLYDDLPDAPERRRAEAEEHLAACPECRQQVAQWRATLGLLDEDRAWTPKGALVIPPAVGADRDDRGKQQSSISGWGRSLPSRPWLPWALAAGVAISASFLTGRAWGPNRAELDRELTRLRTELKREIAADLRAEQQQELTDVVVTTVKATTAGQRELAASLVADFQEARRADRREFVAVLERWDQRRAEDLGQLRASVQSLADQTGGAFQETGSRINALASALPVRSDFESP